MDKEKYASPNKEHDAEHALATESDRDSDVVPPTPATTLAAITIPDGGAQAWLTILGGAFIQACTFGYSSSFGVYQDYYVLHGGISSSDASWVGSLQFFLLFFMGLPAGRLFDAGYFYYMHITGTLLYTFSIFMLSLANPTKYYQLVLAQGVGMGIGSGILLVPALSIQAHYWRKYRSMAMGVVLTGSSCGGIIYPIMLNKLIVRSGFRWAVRASGFLTLALLVAAGSIMRTRFPGTRSRPSGSRLGILAIFRDWAYIFTLIGAFLVIWGMFFPYFYLQLWSNLHGINRTFSFYTIAILNAGSIAGRLASNISADRAGQFNMICPMAAISTALLFAMFGAKSTGSVAVFAVLYGVFSGSIASLLPPTLAVMARDPSEIGMRIGFGYFITSFAILTGNPIDGALLGGGEHWARSLVFSGVVMVAGSVILLFARLLFSRSRGLRLWGRL